MRIKMQRTDKARQPIKPIRLTGNNRKYLKPLSCITVFLLLKTVVNHIKTKIVMSIEN